MIGGRQKIRVLDNGIILTSSAEFHEIAAVRSDGKVFVMPGGHRYREVFTATIDMLVQRGVIERPGFGDIETTTPETIHELYGSARQDVVTAAGGTDTARTKLDKVLNDAAEARASDVKIKEDNARTVVRIKVGGREFTSSMSWTVSEGATAMAAIFDARDEGTGESTALSGKFQSFSVSPGRAAMQLPHGVVKLRGQRGFHEVDTGMGGHVVLRLFYSDEAQQATASLEQLGFDKEITQALARARAKLSGGIIIAGATGDGKSTTLIRCLQRLYEDHQQQISIVTIEDPVEYRIRGDGITQIPVKSAGGPEERTLAFRQALMHFVRINPDVGAISEIRDADAATEVLQFIDTGHQVWTTIHGSTANGILFRLIEMGIPPEELCKPGSIEVLMKQSLAPILCNNCSRPYAETKDSRKDMVAEQLQALEIPMESVRLRNQDGCTLCRPKSHDPVALAAWCGYRRQSAVAEVILPDEGYFERVRRRDSFDAWNYWTTPKAAGGLGGTPLPAKLAGMVAEGTLDPFDAIRKGTDFRSIDKMLVPGTDVTSVQLRPGEAPPIRVVSG